MLQALGNNVAKSRPPSSRKPKPPAEASQYALIRHTFEVCESEGWSLDSIGQHRSAIYDGVVVEEKRVVASASAKKKTPSKKEEAELNDENAPPSSSVLPSPPSTSAPPPVASPAVPSSKKKKKKTPAKAAPSPASSPPPSPAVAAVKKPKAKKSRRRRSLAVDVDSGSVLLGVEPEDEDVNPTTPRGPIATPRSSSSPAPPPASSIRRSGRRKSISVSYCENTPTPAPTPAPSAPVLAPTPPLLPPHDPAPHKPPSCATPPPPSILRISPKAGSQTVPAKGHKRSSSSSSSANTTVATSSTTTTKKRRRKSMNPISSLVSATDWEEMANQSRKRTQQRKSPSPVAPPPAPTAPTPPIPAPLSPTPNAADTSFALSDPDSSFGEVFLKSAHPNPNSPSSPISPTNFNDNSTINDSRASSCPTVEMGLDDSMADLSPVQTDKSFNSTSSSPPLPSQPSPVETKALPPPKSAQILAQVDALYSDIPIGCPIATTTCVSARVFAAASLYNPSVSLSPLSSLLSSFVDAELAVLKPPPEAQRPSSPVTSRLTFCAYDFSSVTPPVDVAIGSNLHIEKCVSKISAIVAELNKLHALPPSSPSTLALSSLLTFTRTLSDKDSEFADMLRTNLTQTLPKTARWPPSRFLGAGRFYEKELSVAVQMASDDENFNDGILPSPLRIRLGELIGATCRYHLRRLFNPVPPSYTTPSKKHPAPDNSACRSKIHELVSMEAPNGRDSAAADGSISSVLNSALSHVYEARRAQGAIEESRKRDSVPANPNASFSAYPSSSNPDASFSVSAVSQKGAENGPLSDDDLEDVIADIELAHVALAGARGAKFACSLMKWPGVKAALKESGGWDCIESVASLVTEVELEEVIPDEAHFLLLSDVSVLLSELDSDLPALNKSEAAATRCLNDLWRKFKCGKQNASTLRRNPNLGVIRTALVEGNSKFVYPTLCVPEEDEAE